MPFAGSEFVNIADGLTDPRDAATVRARFDSALMDLRESNGGVLYVPRVAGGELHVAVGLVRGSLTIPKNVELHVAPGVLVIPVVLAREGGGTSLVLDPIYEAIELQGVFSAPVAQVFMTARQFRAARPRGESARAIGTVQFTGGLIDRVHPEWWGAARRTPGASATDDDALEAALRAAWTHRRSDGGAWLRPLEVELLGSYVISRPLVLEQGSRPNGGITLRAMEGATTQPTFRAVGTSASWRGAPMLRVRGVESVTLEGVRFDGAGVAARCVELDTARQSTQERGHSMRRCVFRGATAEQVLFSATGVVGTLTPGASPLFAGSAHEDLRFEACSFEIPPDVGRPKGLMVSAPASVGVDVHRCTFQGEASVMIHAQSCELSVTNCSFENTSPAGGSDTRTLSELHRDGPDGGLDLYIDNRDQDVPAGLYAQDCRSWSEQFLVTCRGGAVTGGGKDVFIVGLQHRRSRRALFARETVVDVIHKAEPPFADEIKPRPVIDEAVQKRMFVTSSKTLSGDITKDRLAWFSAPSKLADDALLPDDTPDSRKQHGSSPLGATLAPHPIHWHLPTATRVALQLIGCRFVDGQLAPVKTFGVSAPVYVMGVLRGVGGGAIVDGDTPVELRVEASLP